MMDTMHGNTWLGRPRCNASASARLVEGRVLLVIPPPLSYGHIISELPDTPAFQHPAFPPRDYSSGVRSGTRSDHLCGTNYTNPKHKYPPARHHPPPQLPCSRPKQTVLGQEDNYGCTQAKKRMGRGFPAHIARWLHTSLSARTRRYGITGDEKAASSTWQE